MIFSLHKFFEVQGKLISSKGPSIKYISSWKGSKDDEVKDVYVIEGDTMQKQMLRGLV